MYSVGNVMYSVGITRTLIILIFKNVKPFKYHIQTSFSLEITVNNTYYE